MQSFHGKSCNIHYDSGINGESHIIELKTNKNIEIKVSTKDLLEFVAEFIRSNAISQIENMSWKEILNIKE